MTIALWITGLLALLFGLIAGWFLHDPGEGGLGSAAVIMVSLGSASILAIVWLILLVIRLRGA